MPEKYRVEITTIAEKDIEKIWDYLARENLEAANSLILHFEMQIENLEVFPLRCQSIPENELLGTDYRHLLYGNYRIIFRIDNMRIIVMRVLHKARLLELF